MARLKKPRGPSPPAEPRAAALRVPGPLRRLSPLLLGPRGAGRVGRAEEGSIPHTSPALQGVRKLTHLLRLRLSPLVPYHPQGGGRVGFAAARRPRAEERLQNNDGEIPIPPWRRACCPAAGKPSGRRDDQFHRG